MHEYKIIKSATEAESLRRALKNEELERYGEPFTPEFVYEAIRQLPRFASMRVCAFATSNKFPLTRNSAAISKMQRSFWDSSYNLLMTNAHRSSMALRFPVSQRMTLQQFSEMQPIHLEIGSR